MLSFLLADRLMLNEILSFLSTTSQKDDTFQLKLLEKADEWTLTGISITLATIILIIVILLNVLSALYIPDDIADRWKLLCFDILLRLTNELVGDFVQFAFGARWRNAFMRQIISIPYVFQSPPPEWVTIRNELIGSVKVRVYYPKKRRSSAMILFIHGGGWATMRPMYYDDEMCYFIRRLGILIISVDYRRSPEYPYPIPVDDCEAVYRELVTIDYKRYGIDPTQICLMGDSAGGNISTVVAQRQLRKKYQKPKCQILIYPVIHAFDFESPSYQKFRKRFHGSALLNPRLMARWYLLYLGIPATEKNTQKLLRNEHIRRKSKQNDSVQLVIGHHLLPINFIDQTYEKPVATPEDDELCELFDRHGYDADFAPILGTDLKDLSAAMIVTAGYDILRDEGTLYVKLLQSFDVPVLWKHYSKAYHGVLNMRCSDQRKKILHDIVEYIEGLDAGEGDEFDNLYESERRARNQRERRSRRKRRRDHYEPREVDRVDAQSVRDTLRERLRGISSSRSSRSSRHQRFDGKSHSERHIREQGEESRRSSRREKKRVGAFKRKLQELSMSPQTKKRKELESLRSEKTQQETGSLRDDDGSRRSKRRDAISSRSDSTSTEESMAVSRSKKEKRGSWLFKSAKERRKEELQRELELRKRVRAQTIKQRHRKLPAAERQKAERVLSSPNRDDDVSTGRERNNVDGPEGSAKHYKSRPPSAKNVVEDDLRQRLQRMDFKLAPSEEESQTGAEESTALESRTASIHSTRPSRSRHRRRRRHQLRLSSNPNEQQKGSEKIRQADTPRHSGRRRGKNEKGGTEEKRKRKLINGQKRSKNFSNEREIKKKTRQGMFESAVAHRLALEKKIHNKRESVGREKPEKKTRKSSEESVSASESSSRSSSRRRRRRKRNLKGSSEKFSSSKVKKSKEKEKNDKENESSKKLKKFSKRKGNKEDSSSSKHRKKSLKLTALRNKAGGTPEITTNNLNSTSRSRKYREVDSNSLARPSKKCKMLETTENKIEYRTKKSYHKEAQKARSSNGQCSLNTKKGYTINLRKIPIQDPENKKKKRKTRKHMKKTEKFCEILSFSEKDFKSLKRTKFHHQNLKEVVQGSGRRNVKSLKRLQMLVDSGQEKKSGRNRFLRDNHLDYEKPKLQA